MMDKREQVNRNYSHALRFVRLNQCLIYPLFGIGSLMLIGFLAGDYFIGYDFFSKLAENDLGVVPTAEKVGVALKSILPLAVAVSLKFAFTYMPKAVQRILIAILLFIIVATVLSTGTAQVIPLIIDGTERIFPSESGVPDDLRTLFGEDTDIQQNVKEEELTPEAQETISKSRFITEFDSFSRAYLLMTTAAIFTWLALAILYRRMQMIRQAKHAILKRYEILIQKERDLDAFAEAREYLRSNITLMSRIAQDHVISSYVVGLGHPEFHLGQLKLYGNQKKDQRIFSRTQIYLFRWLRFINIGTAEKSIAECHASIENLQLIDPEREELENETSAEIIKLAPKND
jgi:hypothetical protein